MLANPRFSNARARTMRAASLLLVLALPGCGSSTSTTLPTAAFQAGPAFGDGGASDDAMRASLVRGTSSYPLAVGNRWDYVLHARIEVQPDQGEPSAWQERALYSEEVMDVGSFYGRTYFRIATGDPTAGPLSPWLLQRQDESGLYEYDNGPVFRPASVAAPRNPAFAASRAALASAERSLAGSARGAAFARAAAASVAKLERMRQEVTGGEWATTEPAPNELTLLRYPLRGGASWVVRSSPEFGREVLGMDDLVLPIGRVRAWRVQGTSELFGAGDLVLFWYGRAGLVRIHVHAVMDATDMSGNVIGKAVSDYDQALKSASLTGAAGPAK